LNPINPASDDFFMREALKEANKAFEIGEVPVGAVDRLQEQNHCAGAQSN
jgi:tRNA(Arg) A34 adenosine deaminase TadA